MKKVLSFLIIFGCVVSIASQFAYASQEAAYNHNSEGLAKLNAKDFKSAIKEFKEALRYAPSSKKIKANLAVAYNNYGFTLMKQDELREASLQFENGLYYDPDNPYTLYNLAQVYYRLQKVQKAKECLERAKGLGSDIAGVDTLLNRIEGEAKVEGKFDKNETMHFIMASSPDLSVDKTSYIRTYLEEAYGRMGMFLDHYPRNKTVAVLYSEDNYSNMLGDRPHWALAVFDGKVRIPVNKFKFTNEQVIKIIYHEYAHAVVHDIAGGGVPLWLNEGIASRAESFAQPKNMALAGKYIEEFGIIPVWQMPSDFGAVGDRKIATLLYMESYLYVDFILRRVGYTGLKDILNYIGDGKSVEYAIGKVMGMNMREFQKEWEKYIQSQLGIQKVRHR